MPFGGNDRFRLVCLCGRLRIGKIFAAVAGIILTVAVLKKGRAYRINFHKFVRMRIVVIVSAGGNTERKRTDASGRQCKGYQLFHFSSPYFQAATEFLAPCFASAYAARHIYYALFSSVYVRFIPITDLNKQIMRPVLQNPAKKDLSSIIAIPIGILPQNNKYSSLYLAGKAMRYLFYFSGSLRYNDNKIKSTLAD